MFNSMNLSLGVKIQGLDTPDRRSDKGDTPGAGKDREPEVLNASKGRIRIREGTGRQPCMPRPNTSHDRRTTSLKVETISIGKVN
jgi:hypothetical protein